MKLFGQSYRSIWLNPDDPHLVQAIDQRYLPFQLVIEDWRSVQDVVMAIKDMHIRGAGLIGASAGYGMYLAALHAQQTSEEAWLSDLAQAGQALTATRPTAVNLAWAVSRSDQAIAAACGIMDKITAARAIADQIADEDARQCQKIGEYGAEIIEKISKAKDGRVVNILTHCNAGSLAFVDYGSATAPIYTAYQRGIKLHVYVDETRPLNQGGKLTAFELGQNDIPHTIITDNAGGHLMQHGRVDLVIVGCDRVTCTGDVANKIGTYLKAIAAWVNQVPFYVACPSSTIDWSIRDGVKEIPIEMRDQNEVLFMTGMTEQGILEKIRIAPETSQAANYGFDVTPGAYIRALITERGICAATEAGLRSLF
jgi:methylthioribose-1-phosphate isomerase